MLLESSVGATASDEGRDDLLTSAAERRTPRDEPAQAFPTTCNTHLARLIEAAPGQSSAAEYMMRVYSRPLRIYLAGSSFRDVGDHDELVNAFFADRLSRDGFLASWQQGGQRLRYWLIRAFRNFLMEEIRRDHRWNRARTDPLLCAAHPLSSEISPERAYHQEVAMAIVREAVHMLRTQCRERDESLYWDVFERHVIKGEGYESIGAGLGITPRRAAVMSRTITHRFKRLLREQVGWPDASPNEIDEEILFLRESLR